MTARRVAILGGGMLGACTALELARRGRRVTLIEGASDVLQGASRWNEGKVHLGFLYAADPGMNTAMRLIPGGLAFVALVEQFVGRSIDALWTDDDVFLVHRDSVVDAESFARYADRTSALIREAASQPGPARYPADLQGAKAHRLSPSELGELSTSDDVVAGFRVPERSLSTIPVADLLCQALRSEPAIELHVDTWVDGVRRRDDGRLDVVTVSQSNGDLDRFDVVVNALWEGRPAVDASLGIRPPSPWTHRFRAAVFAHAPESRIRSGVVCTGPFGDIKHYADGRLYLSWYDAGLLAEGADVEPPRRAATLTTERRSRVLRETLASLARYFPGVADLRASVHDDDVHGGWVYALGQGSLADRASLLHRRDRFGITVDRGYVSVDTAKYSLAPWLGEQVAQIVVGM